MAGLRISATFFLDYSTMLYSVLELIFSAGVYITFNSVVLVRKRTIPTKRPQPADEVSANFS
jgi:hypothetical protein